MKVFFYFGYQLMVLDYDKCSSCKYCRVNTFSNSVINYCYLVPNFDFSFSVCNSYEKLDEVSTV